MHACVYVCRAVHMYVCTRVCVGVGVCVFESNKSDNS